MSCLGRGTASEVALALRYGKPVAAFASRAFEVGNLDATIDRLSRLADVEAFIGAHIP